MNHGDENTRVRGFPQSNLNKVRWGFLSVMERGVEQFEDNDLTLGTITLKDIFI